jgi:acyl-CoA thioester hydrolase
MGKSSVTYEVALFEKDVEGVKAVGEFVHVYIDRTKGRPTETGMSDELRRNLERITIGKPRLVRAKL